MTKSPMETTHSRLLANAFASTVSHCQMLVLFFLALVSWGSHAAFTADPVSTDPLPSWCEGTNKQAILEFVARVERQDTADYIPIPERIAVFDNDGTLWPENPLPFQLAFALDRVEASIAKNPSLLDDPWIAAAHRRDLAKLLEGDHHEGLLRVLALTHSGMTTEEFQAEVTSWLDQSRHPRFTRRYTELAYQPMLEVLELLRNHHFKTYIVSGGGADFMRVWSEPVYGIPPEQVIGSTGRTRWEWRTSGPVLVKTLDHLFVDDKEGKPVAIHQAIGRKPVVCFGNSDGDHAMLQYTTLNHRRPTLGAIVHHTDADREYAYDRAPKSTGKLIDALAAAPDRGWLVIDMKNDWLTLFPDPSVSESKIQSGEE